MADNITLDSGSGGAVVATDDDGTAHHQYIKVEFGADNTQTKVTSSAGLPVKVIEGVTPGTGASDLGKAEDAAHSSGDVGVMPLAVRNDTLAALAGTDGDYSPFQIDEQGALYVLSTSKISSNNSTTTILTANSTFTGTGEDISNYAAVVIMVKSDQSSATNGLSIEFSTDNTNWDHKQVFSVTGGSEFFIQVMGETQFFRIVYTNGGTDQTYFRMEAILKSVPSIGEVLEIETPLSEEVDAQIVRAVLAAKKPDDSYININATSGGNLKISIEEAETTATGLAKAEDAAHSSGDVGVMALTVRQNSAASTSGTDGDYQPIISDTNGRVHVLDANSAAIVSDTTEIAANYVADASALGKGILIQGDDGTDRKNINVDATTGDVQVDVTNTVTVDGSGVTQPISGTVTANLSATDNAVLDQIEVNTSYGDNTGGGVEAGTLRVTIANDSTGLVSVDDNGGSLTVDVGTALPAGTNAIGKLAANSGIDIGDVDVTSCDGIAAEAAALGNGILIQGDDGTDRKNINVDATTGDVQVDVTNTVTVDGSGVTQPISGTVTANLSATDNAVLDQIEVNTSYGDNTGGGVEAGTLRVTIANDSTGLVSVDDNGGSLTVDVGTALPTGTNLIGDVGISGVRTSGGTTLYKNIDVDESEDEIKGSAGQVYWIHCMNLKASVLYLKFYNATAANVIVGTTVPDLTFPIPTQGDTNGAGFVLAIPNGIAFNTAITVACTTGVADNDSGAPGINECVLNLGYA